MTEFIDPESGEFLDDSGEAEAVDLTTIAVRRHEAKEQEEAWKRIRTVYDAILLKRQQEPHAVYAERIEVRVAGSTYETFDRHAFATELEREELTRSQLVELATAAKSFVKEELVDPPLQAMVAQCTLRFQKKPWIESRAVLKVAPK